MASLQSPIRGCISVSPVPLSHGDGEAAGVTRAHQSLCQSWRDDQSRGEDLSHLQHDLAIRRRGHFCSHCVCQCAYK